MVALLLAIQFAWMDSAKAQAPRIEIPTFKKVEAEGKITNIVPNEYLIIKTEDEEIRANINPRRVLPNGMMASTVAPLELVVNIEALPKWLRKGTSVSCEYKDSEVEKQPPVITSIRMTSAASLPGRFGAGIGELTDLAGDVASGDEPSEGKEVEGEITRVTVGQIFLKVDGKVQKFSLAPDCTVTFQSDQWSNVALGDNVKLNGEEVLPNVVLATRLEVDHIDPELLKMRAVKERVARDAEKTGGIGATDGKMTPSTDESDVGKSPTTTKPSESRYFGRVIRINSRK